MPDLELRRVISGPEQCSTVPASKGDVSGAPADIWYAEAVGGGLLVMYQRKG